MADQYTIPDRWPWPGDSKLGQVQRIARSYRSLSEHLVFGAIPDPAAALAAEDVEWRRFGHFWINPQGEAPAAEDWISVRDCAFYVSQYYPCEPRNVHDWIARGHVEHRIEPDGSASVLWGSVLRYDARRSTA